MTQKELLYFEDAVMHEDNVIKIIKKSIDKLDNKLLNDFLKDQITVHESIKNELIKMMEMKANG